MKKAFTMLELVFVIVVAGILAAAIIPNTRTNPLQEAAVQVLSDIRYTQHLAIVDDKYNATDANWYKKRWQILFSSNGGSGGEMGYTIFSDNTGASSGNPDVLEIAMNPIDSSKVLTGGFNSLDVTLDINDVGFVGTNKLNIGKSYGVTNLTFSNTCSVGGSTRIAFDHLGRPIKGNLSTNNQAYDNLDLIQMDCNITLYAGADSLSIIIAPETGYARIDF